MNPVSAASGELVGKFRPYVLLDGVLLLDSRPVNTVSIHGTNA